MSEYKPYRVLQPIYTVVTDSDDTLLCYPNGKAGKCNQATGKVVILYNPGVVDAPTPEEVELFSVPAVAHAVKPIPQDDRGFDLRLSGVARSIETSRKGREDAVIKNFERNSRRKKSEAPIDVESIEAEKSEETD